MFFIGSIIFLELFVYFVCHHKQTLTVELFGGATGGLKHGAAELVGSKHDIVLLISASAGGKWWSCRRSHLTEIEVGAE